MSAADDLVALLQGQRPAGGLLQTCRLEVAGGGFYGEEAILERGRAAPIDLSGAEEVRGPGQLALFTDAAAVVADVYGERVGRVWAIGSADPAEPEPMVAVAFDPDLRQERGGVLWDAADHTHADAILLERLVDAGERLVAETGAAYRARAFLIRAWGEAEHGVGLFAVHRLGAAPVRASEWSYAAVLVSGGGGRIVRDPAGEAGPAFARL